MLKIGITGGIGSGKSVISKIIQAMGYGVFNSDQVSREIVNSHAGIRQELIALFGEEVYSGLSLNRDFLAGIIFRDDEARRKVNELIHPQVRKAFEEFTLKQKSPLVFNEAAILFETGAYKNFDRVILVTAPVALKIERVKERDKLSEADIRARMERQWTDEQKIPLADFVLVNDERQPLLCQVEETIANLLS